MLAMDVTKASKPSPKLLSTAAIDPDCERAKSPDCRLPSCAFCSARMASCIWRPVIWPLPCALRMRVW